MRLTTVFWALLAESLALYLVIVLWSLPRISAEAGGLVPFDLRPLGYDLTEARAFLAALSDSGRAFYLGTQHRLDLVYPALLGLTFAVGFKLLFRGALWWGLLLLALCVVAFDWLENLAVAGLLHQEPDALTAEAVTTAARWTLLKSVANSLAWLALLAGSIRAFTRRRRRIGD